MNSLTPIQSTQSEAEWIESNHCFKCNLKFTLMKRPSHCRNCGQIFCKTHCSQTTALVFTQSGQKDKVCDDCHFRQRQFIDSAINSLPVHSNFRPTYLNIISGTTNVNTNRNVASLVQTFGHQARGQNQNDDFEAQFLQHDKLRQTTLPSSTPSTIPLAPIAPIPSPIPGSVNINSQNKRNLDEEDDFRLDAPTCTSTGHPSDGSTPVQVVELDLDTILQSSPNHDFNRGVSTGSNRRVPYTRGSVSLVQGHVMNTASYFQLIASTMSMVSTAQNNQNPHPTARNPSLDLSTASDSSNRTSHPLTTSNSGENTNISNKLKLFQENINSSTSAAARGPATPTSRPPHAKSIDSSGFKDSKGDNFVSPQSIGIGSSPLSLAQRIEEQRALLQRPSFAYSGSSTTRMTRNSSSSSTQGQRPQNDVAILQYGLLPQLTPDALVFDKAYNKSTPQTPKVDAKAMKTPESPLLNSGSNSLLSELNPHQPVTTIAVNPSKLPLLTPHCPLTEEQYFLLSASLWQSEDKLVHDSHSHHEHQLLARTNPGQNVTAHPPTNTQSGIQPNTPQHSTLSQSNPSNPTSSTDPSFLRDNEPLNVNFHHPSNLNLHPFRLSTEPSISYLLRLLLSPFSLNPTQHEFRTTFFLFHKQFMTSESLCAVLLAYYLQPPINFPNDRLFFQSRLSCLYLVSTWLQLHYEDVPAIAPFVSYVLKQQPLQSAKPLSHTAEEPINESSLNAEAQNMHDGLHKDDFLFRNLIDLCPPSTALQFKLLEQQIITARANLVGLFYQAKQTFYTTHAHSYIQTIATTASHLRHHLLNSQLYQRQLANLPSAQAQPTRGPSSTISSHTKPPPTISSTSPSPSSSSSSLLLSSSSSSSSSSSLTHLSSLFDNALLPTSLLPIAAPPQFADIITPSVINPQTFSPVTASLFLQTPSIIATILTHRNAALFSTIRLRDCLQHAWVKHNSTLQSLANAAITGHWYTPHLPPDQFTQSALRSNSTAQTNTTLKTSQGITTTSPSSPLQSQSSPSFSTPSLTRPINRSTNCGNNATLTQEEEFFNFDEHYTPHFPAQNALLLLAEEFNRISQWVTTSILQAGLKAALHDEYSRFLQFKQQCALFEALSTPPHQSKADSSTITTLRVTGDILAPTATNPEKTQLLHAHIAPMTSPSTKLPSSSSNTTVIATTLAQPRLSTENDPTRTTGFVLSDDILTELGEAELLAYARSKGFIIPEEERKTVLAQYAKFFALSSPQIAHNKYLNPIDSTPSAAISAPIMISGPTGGVGGSSFLGSNNNNNTADRSNSGSHNTTTTPHASHATNNTTTSQTYLAATSSHPLPPPPPVPPVLSPTSASPPSSQNPPNPSNPPPLTPRSRFTFFNKSSAPPPPPTPLPTPPLPNTTATPPPAPAATTDSTTQPNTDLVVQVCDDDETISAGRRRTTAISSHSPALSQLTTVSLHNTPPLTSPSPLANLPEINDSAVKPTSATSATSTAAGTATASSGPIAPTAPKLNPSNPSPIAPEAPQSPHTESEFKFSIPSQQDIQQRVYRTVLSTWQPDSVSSSSSAPTPDLSSLLADQPPTPTLPYNFSIVNNTTRAFLDMSWHLFKNNDFFTLGALVTGMSHSTIQNSLPFNGLLQSDAKYADIWSSVKAAVSNQTNYSLYRALWAKATSEYLLHINNNPTQDYHVAQTKEHKHVNLLYASHENANSAPQSTPLPTFTPLSIKSIPTEQIPVQQSLAKRGSTFMMVKNLITNDRDKDKDKLSNTSLSLGTANNVPGTPSTHSTPHQPTDPKSLYETLLKNIVKQFCFNKIRNELDSNSAHKPVLMLNNESNQILEQYITVSSFLLSQQPVLTARKVIDIGINSTGTGIGINHQLDSHLKKKHTSTANSGKVVAINSKTTIINTSSKSTPSALPYQQDYSITNPTPFHERIGQPAFHLPRIGNTSPFQSIVSFYLHLKHYQHLLPAQSTSASSNKVLTKLAVKGITSSSSTHHVSNLSNSATPNPAQKIPAIPLPLLPCVMKDLFVLQDNVSILIKPPTATTKSNPPNTPALAPGSSSETKPTPVDLLQSIFAAEKANQQMLDDELTPSTVLQIGKSTSNTHSGPHFNLSSHSGMHNSTSFSHGMALNAPSRINAGNDTMLHSPSTNPTNANDDSFIYGGSSLMTFDEADAIFDLDVTPHSRDRSHAVLNTHAKSHTPSRMSMLYDTSAFFGKKDDPSSTPNKLPPSQTSHNLLLSDPPSNSSSGSTTPLSISMLTESTSFNLQHSSSRLNKLMLSNQPKGGLYTNLSTDRLNTNTIRNTSQNFQQTISFHRIQQQWLTMQPLCIAIHAAYMANIGIPLSNDLANLGIYFSQSDSYTARCHDEVSALPSSYIFPMNQFMSEYTNVLPQIYGAEANPANSSAIPSSTTHSTNSSMNCPLSPRTTPLSSTLPTESLTNLDHSISGPLINKNLPTAQNLGYTGPGDVSHYLYVVHNPQIHRYKRLSAPPMTALAAQLADFTGSPTFREIYGNYDPNLSPFRPDGSLNTTVTSTIEPHNLLYNELLYHNQRFLSLPIPKPTTINCFKSIPLPPFPVATPQPFLASQFVQFALHELSTPPQALIPRPLNSTLLDILSHTTTPQPALNPSATITKAPTKNPFIPQLYTKAQIDQLSKQDKKDYLSFMSNLTALVLFPSNFKLPWDHSVTQFNAKAQTVSLPQSVMGTVNMSATPWQSSGASSLLKQTLSSERLSTFYSYTSIFSGQQQPILPDLVVHNCPIPHLLYKIILSIRSAVRQNITTQPTAMQKQNMLAVEKTGTYANYRSITTAGSDLPRSDSDLEDDIGIHVNSYNVEEISLPQEAFETIKLTLQRHFRGFLHPDWDLLLQYGSIMHSSSPDKVISNSSQVDAICSNSNNMIKTITSGPLAGSAKPVTLLLSELLLLLPPHHWQLLYSNLPPHIVCRLTHLSIWESLRFTPRDDEWCWALYDAIYPRPDDESRIMKTIRLFKHDRQQLLSSTLIATLKTNPSIETDYQLDQVADDWLFEAIQTDVTKLDSLPI